MKFRTLISAVIVALIIAVFISGTLINHTAKATNSDNEQKTSNDDALFETVAAVSAENPLEADKYKKVNKLIATYLDAIANGDVDTIEEVCGSLTDIEKIRVEELGKYIDSYPEYNVFTKIGPTENSYVVYAVVRAKFPDIDTLVPGIYCFYVCMDGNGNYYINEDSLTDEELTYIDALASDESIMQLCDSIDEEYKEILEADHKIAAYIELMTNEIRDAVSEALSGGSSDTDNANDTEDETIIVESCQAKTTEAINVRSSDSISADRLGSLEKGAAVDVIEIRINGWAQIEYEGQTAYIKADYLEIAENADNVPTNGYVMVVKTVNVRSSANVDAEIIGTVATGETLEWVEDISDGFSKVKYNGSIAYVFTEYLENESQKHDLSSHELALMLMED